MFIAQFAAISVVTSLGAADTTAAALRWFGAVALAIAWGAAAFGLRDQPAVAAMIPFGGSALGSIGWLGKWVWLADGVGVGWALALIAFGGWLLRSEEASAPGVDFALQRRARGNYAPEVGVLAACGGSCAVYSSAAAWGSPSPWLPIAAVFAVTMLAPAVASPAVLGLPRSELLPLGRPRWRDLALAAPLVVGLSALAVQVMGATMAVVPANDQVEAFVAAISELADGPLAVFAFAAIPGVCEELLYRGAIYGLLRRGLGPTAANVVQAALFSLAHALSIRLPWTFLLGLVLGEVRRRTGTLWVCVAVHFAFNAWAAGWNASVPWYGVVLIAAIAGIGRPSPRPAAGLA